MVSRHYRAVLTSLGDNTWQEVELERLAYPTLYPEAVSNGPGVRVDAP